MTKSFVWIQRLYLLVLFIYLALPLTGVATISFSGSSRMAFPPKALGLRWHAEFFTDPAWLGAFTRSLIIAGAAAVLSTSAALALVYVQWRYRTRFAAVIGGVASLPFVLPYVILSIIFLLFWGVVGHVGHVENVVISHAITFMALPIALLTLGFGSVQPELIEASKTMGATDATVFRTVTLPIILPFVVSSMLFVAIFSLNEYLISFMVGGLSAQTLPVKIFASLRTGFSPSMCVAAVLFISLGLIAFLIIARISSLPRLLGAKA